MPRREERFETAGIYHVLNRGVDRRLVFENDDDYMRFLALMTYYRVDEVISFSQVRRVPRRYLLCMEARPQEREREGGNEAIVKLLCYCLMPTHFHLLLQQEQDGGISRYLQQIQNAYTRYFNTRHERTGHLFEGQFRSVRIATDEQLLHVTRYIHLNPYVAHLTNEVRGYPWSSLSLYTPEASDGTTPASAAGGNVDTGLLTRMMPPHEYERFVTDHASYARELERIKHVTLEDDRNTLPIPNLRGSKNP